MTGTVPPSNYWSDTNEISQKVRLGVGARIDCGLEFGEPSTQGAETRAKAAAGMSVDSKGNLYVGEASTGRRVQKFTLQAK